MPEQLTYPTDPEAGQTPAMSKKPKRTSKRAKPAKQAPARHVQQALPHLPRAVLENLQHPLHGVDALEQLRQALELVGIDPSKPAQPDPFMGDEWHLTAHARTPASELVALAVEHAEHARRHAATMPKSWADARQQDDALRDLVLCTLLRRGNMRLLEGLEDDRRALRMDGECITLVGPDDDARSSLCTFKLPQVVIDRLRDAVAALAPTRTMAGIAALGITMVLDVLEAEYVKHTGHRFPKRGGEVLEGGRPSRTRSRDAQEAPEPRRPKKRPDPGHKHP
jgi:hypothetical protein